MERKVMWAALRWPGLEHLTIRSTSQEVVADGVVLASIDDRPLRLAYHLSCDASWRTRQVHLELLGAGDALVLTSDGAGHWRDGSGQSVSDLAGAFDIDISVTPFTNTLPLRRLQLQPGESQHVRVVYVQAPELRVRLAEQRYTCLEAGTAGGRYRYESGRFRADLTVDADGLVVDYAGLWQRADRPTSAQATQQLKVTQREE